MELLQLKYFKSVAMHENISKAAKELHISQPSLSITIKRLEEELTVPLFNRKGKTITLNPYGESFLKNVEAILNRLDSAKTELLELYGHKNTHLKLSSLSSIILSGLLKRFLTKFPDVTMTQTISNSNLLEKLKDRSIDFAITAPPIHDSLIETIDLIEEQIVVVIPKSHPLANAKSVYLKDLRNEKFIAITDDYSFKLTSKELFKNAGFTPNVIFEGDISIIAELLDMKKALALAPLSVCLHSNNQKYRIATLKDSFNTRKISLSYLKGVYLSDLAKEFLDFTIEHYKTSWFTLDNYKKKKERESL